MIRPGFQDRGSRQDLFKPTLNRSAVYHLARRTTALVLLDDGMSFVAISKALQLDDDASSQSSHTGCVRSDRMSSSRSAAKTRSINVALKVGLPTMTADVVNFSHLKFKTHIGLNNRWILINCCRM